MEWRGPIHCRTNPLPRHVVTVTLYTEQSQRLRLSGSCCKPLPQEGSLVSVTIVTNNTHQLEGLC